MRSIVLWSLCAGALSPRSAEATPAAAVVRAADDERPQRRSREDGKGVPHVQMGVGPTALAMLALVAAIVARTARRRRAHAATGSAARGSSATRSSASGPAFRTSFFHEQRRTHAD
ncbi:MAG: hypothetical protein KDK70_07815 [Myxococcales bacterium]|nr:hypothetical protein [Myxococcales bacterium]